MRTRRDFLTPALVIFGVLIVILALWVVICDAQTHTMPGSNVVPSGSSLTINSGGSITAAAGSTVTGFGGGGGTPGGSNTQLQYNNSSAFGGITGATTNGTTLSLKNLTMSPTSGTNNSVIDWGANFGFPALYLYNDGVAGDRTGWGLLASEMQFFTINGAHYSWNKGGDMQSTGVNELMRLDATAGTLNVLSGYKLGGSEFPIAANGIVKRTAANTYAAAVSGTDYQAASASLTSWAAITRASGIDTWVTTPSSANLRSAMTDENGTGALLFSGATTPDFTTGFTIGAAAASGKIPMGDGTKYGPSTPVFPTTVGTAGYTVRSDGTTGYAAYPQDMFNSSVSSQSPSNLEVYLTNSNVVVAAGDFKAKGQYRCLFDVTKSAGTGTIVLAVKVGTAGSTGDATILTFTFGAGTSVADTGTFEIIATWRTVGSGTSAVMQGVCRAQKNAATTTGLWNNTGTDLVIVATTSSGFNSSTATNIGVSFTGNTAFAGTVTLVQANLLQ